jgi:hypothetical protein
MSGGDQGAEMLKKLDAITREGAIFKSEGTHVYRYKVSLETDQKCVKPQVTVYSDDAAEAKLEAISMLEDVFTALIVKDFKVADIVSPNALKEKGLTYSR